MTKEEERPIVDVDMSGLDRVIHGPALMMATLAGLLDLIKEAKITNEQAKLIIIKAEQHYHTVINGGTVILGAREMKALTPTQEEIFGKDWVKDRKLQEMEVKGHG